MNTKTARTGLMNLLLWLCIGLVLQVCLFLLAPSSVHAGEESFCAQVVKQIQQELTLERQGFEATMKINNPLVGFDLTSVKISVNFTDTDDNPVSASSDPNNTSAGCAWQP